MLLITGATGTIGTRLVGELAGRDDVRALVRTPRDLPVATVIGDLHDAASVDRALDGFDTLFLLSPPGAEDMVRTQIGVVDRARAAGVRRVVKLSSIGADEPGTRAGIIRAHRDVERHIETSGMAFTHLRPHWFMDNELGQAGNVASQGTLYAPDVTRIAAIDARDVAAAAARVLTTPGHEDRAYTLTGPEALSYADMARILARATGTPVTWTEVTHADAHASMVAGGLPAALATGFVEIMARYAEGGVTATPSTDVQRLLGRMPRSFAAFARDHAAAFAPAVRQAA